MGVLREQLVALLSHRPARASVAREVDDDVDGDSSLPLRRAALRSGATSYFVDTDDIDWIEADTYYSRIWTGVRSHLLRQSLAHLETVLDPHCFVRVHRAAIVNITKVSEIGRVAIGKYCVWLRDGRRISVSRDRRRALHAALGWYRRD